MHVGVFLGGKEHLVLFGHGVQMPMLAGTFYLYAEGVQALFNYMDKGLYSIRIVQMDPLEYQSLTLHRSLGVPPQWDHIQNWPKKFPHIKGQEKCIQHQEAPIP